MATGTTPPASGAASGRSVVSRHVLTLGAVAFNVLGTVLDIASSMRRLPGVFETNPYARDAAGGFVLAHALVYYGIWLVLMLAVGALLYFGLRRFSEPVAQVSAAVWLIYDGVGSYVAALHNLWLAVGWYVR